MLLRTKLFCPSLANAAAALVFGISWFNQSIQAETISEDDVRFHVQQVVTLEAQHPKGVVMPGELLRASLVASTEFEKVLQRRREGFRQEAAANPQARPFLSELRDFYVTTIEKPDGIVVWFSPKSREVLGGGISYLINPDSLAILKWEGYQ